MFSYGNYVESAKYISAQIGERKPEVLVVLGSGLGFLAGRAEDKVEIPYSEIPNFSVSTAPGHAGKLVIGNLGGVCAMIMQGRVHYYEGYSPEQIVFPVRTAKLLGVKSLLLTNACGAVNTEFKVGDIMAISDHIKLCAPNPLIGPNIDEFGPRFCDMTYTYSPVLRKDAKKIAKELEIGLREGVYFYFTGPQYETPAEIRAARTLGGDVVGMSTVYEAIAANHCGMDVLGFSLVTNMAAGVLDKRLDQDEVIRVAEEAKKDFSALVMGCLPFMGDKNGLHDK